MQIKRIQVKEGFLNGLDLSFGPGLNVLIGARGTGKTSVIELLRFCLGVNNFTSKFEASSREHALAVLGTGEVVVTIETSGREVLIARTQSDDGPRSTESYERPIIFSQTEIEHIGLEAASRLKIIDRFRKKPKAENRKELIASEIRSLTVELQSIRREIAGIGENIAILSSYPAELLAAKKEQKSFLESIRDSEGRQEQLAEVDAELSIISVREKVLTEALQQLEGFSAKVSSLFASGPNLESWPPAAGPDDLLEPVRKVNENLREIAEQTTSLLSNHISRVQELIDTNFNARLVSEDRARGMRQELESLIDGAGLVTGRVTELEEKVGQLNALRSSLESQQRFAEQIAERRSALLTEWEKLSDDRFNSRVEIAERLNQDLGPNLDVRIERAGEFSNYISAISASLRGSGLHYNQLAPAIASKMSPREFTEAVERADFKFISEVAEIGLDRAEKICSEIRLAGTEEIICSELDDVVKMYLLDSTEYKSTENLSVGQRCTVVLPIILQFTDVPLVVDQPEDHLDNAFIVDTLIEAIHQHRESGQLIFSTHNANIPVLGEANSVIHMDSDGKRGFIRNCGNLESLSTVESITSVMEGGIDAFRRRGKFYDERYQEDR